MTKRQRREGEKYDVLHLTKPCSTNTARPFIASRTLKGQTEDRTLAFFLDDVFDDEILCLSRLLEILSSQTKRELSPFCGQIVGNELVKSVGVEVRILKSKP